MTKSTENALAKSIGSAIAHKRTQAGMTQEAVAAKLGIGNEAVSRLERGIAMPSIQRLYELAELFQCEAVDLLTAGSLHVDDQLRHLKKLLAPLEASDRQLVLAIVEQLSARLAP
jgi:transcriptional regulator with XRE-family HTH domain